MILLISWSSGIYIFIVLYFIYPNWFYVELTFHWVLQEQSRRSTLESESELQNEKLVKSLLLSLHLLSLRLLRKSLCLGRLLHWRSIGQDKLVIDWLTCWVVALVQLSCTAVALPWISFSSFRIVKSFKDSKLDILNYAWDFKNLASWDFQHIAAQIISIAEHDSLFFHEKIYPLRELVCGFFLGGGILL